MRKSIYLALCVSILFMFTSCKKSEQPSNLFDPSSLSNVSEAIEYDTAKVTRGDLKENIIVNGVAVSPRVSLDVRFEYDVVLKKVYVSYNQIIKEGELIAELYTDEIEQDIEFQRFIVEQEKAIYNKMENSGRSKEELNIQALEIEISEKKLEKLIKDMEKHKIYAQTDCYIIKGDLISGRKVEAGESLFIIADATKYVIKNSNKIDMTKFTNIKIGDYATFTHGNQTFTGQVCFISFDERNFGEIHFQVNDNVSFGRKKLQDVRLSVKFHSIIREDVLIIPKVAVKNNYKDYVETIKDGVRRLRYIKCGVSGTDEQNLQIIQVLGGLKEGETIILNTKSTLN